ncbi:hypothetical protein JCM11641_000783 [Rhodosporidiobolus odoratus]
MSSTTKRDGSPSTSAHNGTPAKRARLDDSSAAPANAAEKSSAAAEATPATGETPSSPFNAKDTDSPSTGRGGKKGGRGGRDGRGGRGGGRGGKNDRGPDSRSWGGRNTGKGEKEMRQWGGKSRNEEQADKEGGVGEEGEKKDKLPKKKVAVLIGYNGIGYKGSQHNPGTPTIEGEFFKALVKAGAISEDNSVNPQKVSLSRAARTDAGVHAAINVISLKMILTPPGLPEGTSLEDYLNTFLPPAMRVWSVIRVQGSFDPRRLCDHRQYEYTLPTHVFLGPKPGCSMAQTLEKQRAAASSAAADEEKASAPHPAIVEATAAFWSGLQEKQPEGVLETKFADDVQAKKAWRMPKEVLEQARALVKEYEGSHNYYNFTVGKDFRDRSCQRVMKKLEISEPFVVNDTEYISVTFLGQSFMLHQIRKMIGLFILTIRSGTPSSLIPETFGPSRIHVPKAPGLGLLLIEPQYIEYNKRVLEANTKNVKLGEAGKLNEKELEDSTRETIDPIRLGLTERLEEFKKEQVYKRMWEVEEESLVFSKWLNYLDAYIGHDFEYLNPKGLIPSSATYKKGENPEKTRAASTTPASGTATEGQSAQGGEGEKAEKKEGELSEDEDVGGEEEG